MIFGTLNRGLNPEKMWHEHLAFRLSDGLNLPHEIPQKVIFTSIIHAYFWLFTLSQKTFLRI